MSCLTNNIFKNARNSNLFLPFPTSRVISFPTCPTDIHLLGFSINGRLKKRSFSFFQVGIWGAAAGDKRIHG